MGFFAVGLESSALVMQMLLFGLAMTWYKMLPSPAGDDFCFLYQNKEETEEKLWQKRETTKGRNYANSSFGGTRSFLIGVLST